MLGVKLQFFKQQIFYLNSLVFVHADLKNVLCQMAHLHFIDSYKTVSSTNSAASHAAVTTNLYNPPLPSMRTIDLCCPSPLARKVSGKSLPEEPQRLRCNMRILLHLR